VSSGTWERERKRDREGKGQERGERREERGERERREQRGGQRIREAKICMTRQTQARMKAIETQKEWKRWTQG
jgi:hypothetical protein